MVVFLAVVCSEHLTTCVLELDVTNYLSRSFSLSRMIFISFVVFYLSFLEQPFLFLLFFVWVFFFLSFWGPKFSAIFRNLKFAKKINKNCRKFAAQQFLILWRYYACFQTKVERKNVNVFLGLFLIFSSYVSGTLACRGHKRQHVLIHYGPFFLFNQLENIKFAAIPNNHLGSRTHKNKMHRKEKDHIFFYKFHFVRKQTYSIKTNLASENILEQKQKRLGVLLCELTPPVGNSATGLSKSVSLQFRFCRNELMP